MASLFTEASVLQVGGLSGLALMGVMLFRSMVRHVSKSALDFAGDSAERNVIATLREEIARLETIVIQQQRQTERMQADFLRLQQTLLNAQSAAMMCMAIVQAMCPCETEARERLMDKLQEILDLHVTSPGSSSPENKE